MKKGTRPVHKMLFRSSESQVVRIWCGANAYRDGLRVLGLNVFGEEVTCRYCLSAERNKSPYKQFPPDPGKTYLRDACTSMCEALKKAWGTGWDRLGVDIQRALIIERVYHVVTAKGPEGEVSRELMIDMVMCMKDLFEIDVDREVM